MKFHEILNLILFFGIRKKIGFQKNHDILEKWNPKNFWIPEFSSKKIKFVMHLKMNHEKKIKIEKNQI